MYLDEQKEVPFETLVYLIATINYGGRVTDKRDERLIDGILRKYMNKDIMNKIYNYTQNGQYYNPETLELDQI